MTSTNRERARREMTPARVYECLNQLVGRWETETVRVRDPLITIPGVTVIDWMEGGNFLVMRARHEHAEIPASFAILGFMTSERVASGDLRSTAALDPSALRMHVYDAWGAFRRYRTSISEDMWRLEPERTGDARRFVGMLPSQDCIAGRWQVLGGDGRWEEDLEITYRRWEPQR